MKALLNRAFSSFAYSNIALRYSPEQQAAYLTLSNEKKRNPLSL